MNKPIQLTAEELSKLPLVNLSSEAGVFGAGYDRDNPPKLVRFLIPGSLDGFVQAPETPDATGLQGQWSFDLDYLYICVATNTWKRTALATW